VSDAVERTRRWIESVVIGLNLCPFARRPFDAGLIRYVVSTAADEGTLLDDLAAELTALAAAPRTEIETTILLHPHALPDFLDYNDFLATADDLLRRLRLEGVIQIASFHPQYLFAGTRPDDVENFTNRSPYPMLHLLREESITEVGGDPAVLDGIPKRNEQLLRKLGRAKVTRLVSPTRQREGLP
jgi:hypothetical protein